MVPQKEAARMAIASNPLSRLENLSVSLSQIIPLEVMDPVGLDKSEFSLLSIAGSEELLDPSSTQDACSNSDSAPSGVPRTPSGPHIPLGSFNAQAAKAIYKPLGPTEIRLVKIHPGGEEDEIHCSVFNVEHGTRPAYEALSYVWGSLADLESIFLNGAPWKVTQNLEGALRQLRLLNEDRVMWIDALSINQSNVPERNSQVAKMRDIYSLASKTLVWLGKADDPVCVLFFALLTICKGTVNFDLLDHDKNLLDNILLAFSQIRRLDYWSRAWVTQEIMYSREVSTLYGSFSATYSEFTAFWNAAETRLSRLESDDVQRYHKLDEIARLKIGGPNALPSPGAALVEEFMTLQEWRKLIELKEYTEPRDMVFAYYGCFRPDVRRRIVIDYSKSLEDILVHTMRVLIEESDCLDVILDTPGNRIGPPLPSWVPRIRKDELSKFVSTFSDLKAHGDISPVYTFLDGGTILQVVGVSIGVVHAVARPYRKDDTIGRISSWIESETLYLDFMTYLFDLVESLDVPLEGDLLDCYVAAIVAHGHKHPEVVHYLLKGCIDAGFDPPKWPFKPEWFQQSISFGHFGRRMFSFVGADTLLSDVDKSRPVLGYGLGANGLARGDRICVLTGCSAPAILRPLGNHYTLLGDAYVPGFMFGEAMSGIGDGTREPEAFSLC